MTFGCKTDKISIPFTGLTIFKLELANFIVMFDILSILIISFFMSMLPYEGSLRQSHTLMIRNQKYDTKENLWKHFQDQFGDEEIIDIEMIYP